MKNRCEKNLRVFYFGEYSSKSNVIESRLRKNATCLTTLGLEIKNIQGLEIQAHKNFDEIDHIGSLWWFNTCKDLLWQKAISFGVKIGFMRTFKIELKQKQNLGPFCKAKTGKKTLREKKREKERMSSFCHFIKKHLERKREKVWERKERKEEEEEKEGEEKEEENR